MSTINSLNDLTSGTHITEEQIIAIINALHVKMYNIQHDGGDLAAINTSTGGPTGITINYAASLAELRNQLEFYNNLLANPHLRGDFAIGYSQSSPEDFNPNVTDFATRYD